MEKKTTYQAYSKDCVLTTIFEDAFVGEELISTEVKGFYFGEPYEEGVKDYFGNLKVKF